MIHSAQPKKAELHFEREARSALLAVLHNSAKRLLGDR
jgi:hypothetical protein